MSEDPGLDALTMLLVQHGTGEVLAMLQLTVRLA